MLYEQVRIHHCCAGGGIFPYKGRAGYARLATLMKLAPIVAPKLHQVGCDLASATNGIDRVLQSCAQEEFSVRKAAPCERFRDLSIQSDH